MEKTAGLGSKIDLRLAIIRIGFFHNDHEIISSNIDKAQMYAFYSFSPHPPSLSLHSEADTPHSPSRARPETHSLVDEGGDWDRRNRLKVYEGLHLLSIRNFKKGGELLLDTLSTFTATELIDYDDFVTLCVLSGVLTLERRELKKKVRFVSVVC